MTSTSRSTSKDPTGGPWAAGFAMTAGVLMLTLGSFQALQGLAAILTGDIFVTFEDYVFDLNLSTWGWVHLLIGVAVATTGAFVITGATWARMVGIGLAVVSAISNFMFIPYYPFWAILIIAFDVAVIWALSRYNPAPEAPWT